MITHPPKPVSPKINYIKASKSRKEMNKIVWGGVRGDEEIRAARDINPTNKFLF